MTCPSANPPPAGRSQIGQGGRSAAAERGGQGERQEYEAYGPLDVERRVKDDGRVLVLYAHRRGASG